MNNPISKWPIQERPRERLINKGVQALTDAELLAVLISTGEKGCSALSLAQQLISEVQNLKELGGFSYNHIVKMSGIGPAKACRILAALEIGRRRQLVTKGIPPYITNPEQAVEILKPKLQEANQEKFIILLLDNKYRLIKEVLISIGSLDQALVHPRDVFKAALEVSAAAIVLGHNHTSGDSKPSPQDIVLTTNLFNAAKLMQLTILDHVIIGDENYFSMKNEGVVFSKRGGVEH